MKIDLVILQLGIVFLPGLIWANLDAKYAAKEKPSDADFLIRAFLFGLIVYAVEFVIYQATGHQFRLADLSAADNKEILNLPILREILWGLLISLVLSILWLYFSRYKILTWFLQLISATKKYGDEDVWDYTFNSSATEVEYVHVRDLENEFVYAGWVDLFSETGRVRELLLREVIVSNFVGDKLYEVPLLYLARPVDGVLVEFPYRESKEGNADGDEQLKDTAARNGDGRVRPGEAPDGGLYREGRSDGGHPDHTPAARASADEAGGRRGSRADLIPDQEEEIGTRPRPLAQAAIYAGLSILLAASGGLIAERAHRGRRSD